MNNLLFIFFLFIQISLSLSELRQNIPYEYEVAPWYSFKDAVITYSFDDGTPNHLRKAIPLLDKYNLKASFNLITNKNINDWRGYKTAAENEHEMASHTVSHPNLQEIDYQTQVEELKESKKLIEKMVGQECVTLVYPYCVPGDYDIAKKYYISGRSCSHQYIDSNPDDMFDLSSFGIGNESNHQTGEDLNEIVDKAVEQKKWVVFLIHGVDFDDGDAYSPFEASELEKHFQYVTKKDNFWVATFKDVSKYILEANSLNIFENLNMEGNTIIRVTTGYKTDITKLDVPVTVSRVVDEQYKKVNIIRESDNNSIHVEMKNGKIIFDVVPGEKYIMKCE